MNSSSQSLARNLLIMPSRSPSQKTPAPRTEAKAEAAEPRSLKLRDVIRAHILNVLIRTDWVIEGPHGAAALLDMKPSTLRYRIRILDIKKPPKADAEDNVTILFPRRHIPFRT